MIEKLYAAAEECLVFNMLDDTSYQSGDLIIAHDKQKVVEFCKSQSTTVVLKDDYLDIDFTVCMKK